MPVPQILSEDCGQKNQTHCLMSGRAARSLVTKMTELTQVYPQLTITLADKSES
jgi:hypothetical protein